MYFQLFPPVSIEGSINKSLEISGLEAIKSIQITPKKLSCTLNIDGNEKQFDIVSFNFPFMDIHKRVDPDEDFPLELMPLITIEFLEAIAQQLKGYTLLSHDIPKAGYLEFYLGDIYPISVRGSTKDIYPATAELRPLRKDYFVALNTHLEIDFEEQLENSLTTFAENVLRPMSAAMTEVFELDKDLCEDGSIIKVLSRDFEKLVSRTDELISIVSYHMDQTAERNKSFLRLTLPLMLKQALIENYHDYIRFKSQTNEIKLEIIKREVITADQLMQIIVKLFH
ncbi:MAG: hypothetical protein EAX86_13425 [Candidatus Heimdallarchaeota archaeon]|nr:hypothetical protein [Candidatus Heimdallarchaeota archaeon]